MFDLVAEIATHERHQRSGMKVRRAEHLAQIPFRLSFVLELLSRELLCAIGKVAAEDDHV